MVAVPPRLSPGHSGGDSRLTSESWKHLATADTGVGWPLEKKFLCQPPPSTRWCVMVPLDPSCKSSACAMSWGSSWSGHSHLLLPASSSPGRELGAVHSAWVGKQSPFASNH